jgi:hypothetical protein
MAGIRTPRSARRAPWGWIAGFIGLALLTFAVIWWLRAGAPPTGATGQEGVEQRDERGQPGLQPGTPATPDPAVMSGARPD